MAGSYHRSENATDWKNIFRRVAGSVDTPLSGIVLSTHLENVRNVPTHEAESTLNDAVDSGNLGEIVLEKFPDVYVTFLFVPRPNHPDPETVFVPFWSYICTEVVQDRSPFSVAKLCEKVDERANGDIPEYILNMLDEYVSEIAPVTTGFQSVSGRSLRGNRRGVYETLAQSHGPSEGLPERYF